MHQDTSTSPPPVEKLRTEELRAGDTLLRVRELAAILNVSTTAVYRLVDRREIPLYRFARKLRFRTSDVLAFLRRCRIEQIDDARRG
jgi:excisionase family DNA binding protein